MNVSEKGLTLIKKYESLKLDAYLCPAGVPTIGYGHTRSASIGQHISEATAVSLLKSDVLVVESQLNHVLSISPVNQNQFDALVSFVFNLGIGAFKSSTLFKKMLVDVNDPTIAYEFSRWNKAGGNVLNGLVKRRKEESDLYFAK